MPKQYIEFTTKPGYATLWDEKPTDVETIEIDVDVLLTVAKIESPVIVTFDELNAAVMSEHDAHCLYDVVNYSLEDEAKNFAEHYGNIDGSLPEMNDDNMDHIYWSLRNLVFDASVIGEETTHVE